tara:strand:+ start:1919 stop:2413 length:495 start_codon:yes stop_codon:yes gene_type:complete
MKTITLCLFLGSFTAISAQNNATIISPSVLSTAGTTLQTNGYNLSFTIGELAIETFVQGEYVVTQGFNQEDYIITPLESPSDNVRVSIFPNPTQDVLNISFIDFQGKADILIRDIKGNLIHSKKGCTTINQQSFDISTFAQGIYFLEITTNSTELRVYKIQKIK